MSTISNLTLRESHSWSGKYNGVPFEVKQWAYDSSGGSLPDKCWNYYLYLNLAKFEDKAVADSLWLEDKEVQFSPTSPVRVTHDYYGNPTLSGLEMHGGITFYEKMTPDKQRIVKVGCDFQHLGDAEQHWDLEGVLADMKSCVDAFLAAVKYNVT